jgi:membrane-associated protein
MSELFDYLLNLQEHLATFVGAYGPWVYALLFAIVFCETGLVVTPFLPGDSLLFTIGALSATGIMDIRLAAPLLIAAGVAGNTTNYSIGHFIGPRVFTAEGRSGFRNRLLNRNRLMQAHEFFLRHGGKAVVLGQFLPIVRTFVPFVAGCGAMPYRQFAFYTLTGAVLWVGLCMGAGYAFGNIPWVKERFELVVIGIISVSLIPAAWGFFASRRKKLAAGSANTP